MRSFECNGSAFPTVFDIMLTRLGKELQTLKKAIYIAKLILGWVQAISYLLAQLSQGAENGFYFSYAIHQKGEIVMHEVYRKKTFGFLVILFFPI